MRILAIETATSCAGCALWDDNGPVASFTLVARQRHSEVLMPAIDELCRLAGWSPHDLTGVAVDRGPGLFTGLRVGLATAGAMARALGVPAAAVTSLDALAHPYRHRPGLLVPVVDARRGQVYWALYQADGVSTTELRPPAVIDPEGLAAELAHIQVAESQVAESQLAQSQVTQSQVAQSRVTQPGQRVRAGQRVLAVGDGARRYQEQLVAAGAEVGDKSGTWPSPLVVAELGARLLSGRTGGEQSFPEPLYLRPADVRIGWEEVGGRVTGPAASPPEEPKLAP